MGLDRDLAEQLGPHNTNQELFSFFHSLAREVGICLALNLRDDRTLYGNPSFQLDIMEPKTPEDIYKIHLEPQRIFGQPSTQPDSAAMNVAASFVIGLVNCGFGRDSRL